MLFTFLSVTNTKKPARQKNVFPIEWHLERLRKRHEFEITKLSKLAATTRATNAKIAAIHKEITGE